MFFVVLLFSAFLYIIFNPNYLLQYTLASCAVICILRNLFFTVENVRHYIRFKWQIFVLVIFTPVFVPSWASVDLDSSVVAVPAESYCIFVSVSKEWGGGGLNIREGESTEPQTTSHVQTLILLRCVHILCMTGDTQILNINQWKSQVILFENSAEPVIKMNTSVEYVPSPRS